MAVRGKPRYIVEDRGYMTPCWIWQGAHYANGYGSVHVPGTRNNSTYSHRFFYEWFKGRIPPSRELDHLCRVRECCNPNHLEAVTRKTNARRGAKSKLTPEQVARIKILLANGRAVITIADEFGISSREIYSIRARERWA
jgi:hypothetical protein